MPLKTKYFNFIQSHLSLFVLAFGSLCFFLLNILLKEELTEVEYGTYSIFITYISLLSSFGMLGFEQTLLRTSKIKLKLEIEKAIIVPSLLSILFVSGIGSYLMISNYDIKFGNYDMKFAIYVLFVLSILVIFIKLVFNLYRLRSKFTISQISLNFWKIGLFFIVGYYILFDIPFIHKDLFVNISSIAGKEGNPNASAYSTSKAGVIGLTKSLGKELANKNIAVNAVTPAAAKTRIFDQMTKEHIDYMLSKIPRNRFILVEELASLVTWLVSEENSYTTGAVFDLSGGRATY